jgi:trans-2,3-dihydro-3-hydroxyanthranilate isomerase
VLVHFTRMADGAHEFVIEQGYEMGRPSLIRLSMTIKGGQLTAGAIAGEAVVVSEGTIEA